MDNVFSGLATIVAMYGELTGWEMKAPGANRIARNEPISSRGAPSMFDELRKNPFPAITGQAGFVELALLCDLDVTIDLTSLAFHGSATLNQRHFQSGFNLLSPLPPCHAPKLALE